MTPTTPTPGETPTAAERAYAHTKTQIIRGTLAGGALISEGQICDELGISRTPVHEAFLRLGAEKLIVLSSRKGAVVVPISPNEAQDVLQMREAIETASAARVIAAGGLTQAQHEQLYAILDRQQAALGDVAAFTEADDAFHLAVITSSGNAIAINFYEALRDRQQRLRNHLLTLRPEQLAESLEDHRRLATVLGRSDLDAFTSALKSHLERYRGLL